MLKIQKMSEKKVLENPISREKDVWVLFRLFSGSTYLLSNSSASMAGGPDDPLSKQNPSLKFGRGTIF